MAERLVAEMTDDWDPKQYHDEYRDELLAFIKKRSRAGKVTAAPETEDEPAKPKRADIIDIAELLKRSLAKTGRGSAAAPATEIRLRSSGEPRPLSPQAGFRRDAGAQGAHAAGREAPVLRDPAPRTRATCTTTSGSSSTAC